jgi:hypothetical protein
VISNIELNFDSTPLHQLQWEKAKCHTFKFKTVFTMSSHLPLHPGPLPIFLLFVSSLFPYLLFTNKTLNSSLYFLNTTLCFFHFPSARLVYVDRGIK